MTPTLRNENGLTLLEVIGAIALLSVVVSAFLAVSSYVTLSGAKNDQAAAALLIAEEQLNIAKARIQANAAYEANPAVPGYLVTIQETEWASPAAYAASPVTNKRSVSVQSVIRRPSDGRTKLLTCTVAWGTTG